MLHDLDQDQAQVVVPLFSSLGQLQILDLQSAPAVLRRDNAPVKGDGVALLLDFRLQGSQVFLDDLVRFALDVPVSLLQGNFLFEFLYLCLELAYVLAEFALRRNALDDGVIGLNPAEFE